jgi:hypothetical protein
MVATETHAYSFTSRLFYSASLLLAGNLIGQAIAYGVIYWTIYDMQAAGMLTHMIMQKMSYFVVFLSFVLLGFANLLIKRQLSIYKQIRAPLLGLLLCSAISSVGLIPRMDYLREIALLDGLPVMFSPLAGYFLSLNILTMILFMLQILLAYVVGYRLSSFSA